MIALSVKYDFCHKLNYPIFKFIVRHLMKIIATTLMVSLLKLTNAQTIENINASFDGEKVTVSYVLSYSEGNQKFKIDFYSSHDNYGQPLQVTGDAGENVLPGRTKLVIWNAKNALPSEFDADIRIRIKATKMAAPKLEFEPLALKTYKKGRTISMKWIGGYPSDKITIELKKNNVTDLRVAELIDNAGAYEWKMPRRVKGKNYQLILTNASNKGEPAASSEFRVKPRTPFLVKILPILAAGGVAAALGGGSGSGNIGGGNGDSVLPGPATPPGG